MYFYSFAPLEKDNLLHLNNLQSPPAKDDLCQVWLKLAQWLWRRSLGCATVARGSHFYVWFNGKSHSKNHCTRKVQIYVEVFCCNAKSNVMALGVG
jgi:hypothetical protein